MRSICLYSLLLVALSAFSQKVQFIPIVDNPTTSIKDQAGPTCWSYATCSFIESELLRLKKGAFNFSEDFFVYYAYIEKAHNYVLRQANTSFRSGGMAHDVLRIIKDKGIVPHQNFKIDTFSDNGELPIVLKNYLDAILKVDYMNENWMNRYCKLLDSYFGPLPEYFKVNGQTYTPVSFAKSLNINTEDYISLTSFTHHPFNSSFVLEVRDNYSSDLFYNVNLNEFIQIIDSSLLKGYTLVWDGDLYEYNNNDIKKYGLAMFPTESSNGISILKASTPEIDVDQQLRQKYFETLRTRDSHLMHIVGLVKTMDGKGFYKIKDSGGIYGPYNGYIYMSESHLKLKTVSVMVNKNSLPNSIRKRIDEK
jgi:bleomycin hydrolase